MSAPANEIDYQEAARRMRREAANDATSGFVMKLGEPGGVVRADIYCVLDRNSGLDTLRANAKKLPVDEAARAKFLDDIEE